MIIQETQVDSTTASKIIASITDSTSIESTSEVKASFQETTMLEALKTSIVTSVDVIKTVGFLSTKATEISSSSSFISPSSTALSYSTSRFITIFSAATTTTTTITTTSSTLSSTVPTQTQSIQYSNEGTTTGKEEISTGKIIAITVSLAVGILLLTGLTYCVLGFCAAPALSDRTPRYNQPYPWFYHIVRRPRPRPRYAMTRNAYPRPLRRPMISRYRPQNRLGLHPLSFERIGYGLY